MALPGLFRSKVAVTDDGGGVADELIARLRDAGADAVPWDGTAQDLGALVFLGGLRPGEDDDAAVTFEAFHAAHALAGHGSFVTVGRLGRAGPGALARSCAREWPGAAVRAIEVEYEDGGEAAHLAAVVAAELLAGDTEADIVIRADGGRAGWTMVPNPLRPSPSPSPSPPSPRAAPVIGPESVVLISGGGRGVTAACARALARAHRPRIVLIGRTPPAEDPPALRAARTETELRGALVTRAVRAGERPQPFAIETELRQILAARELRETLEDIAAAGSPVRYIAADVADADAVSEGLRAVRAEWGPVTGLVHGAGVLADRFVADKTDEQFGRVLRVKAQGFRNLLDLVAADDPAFVCVFSSVVVSAGNAGQCDYAAANEIAERMALDWSARHSRCLVKAIAWGPWRGGMVSPELAEVFGERRIPLIPLAEGAAAFVAELTAPAEQVRCLITAGFDDSGGRTSRAGELEVSEVAQTWLADHRVGGRAVVPLAVVLDWMLRLVDSPEAVSLHDIDVVRGIAAPAVVSVQRSGSALTVLTDSTEPCYRARLAARAPETNRPSAITGAESAPWPGGEVGPASEPGGLAPIDRDPLYDGDTLFHGPSLQVLRRIDGLGAEGATGEVVGSAATAWPDDEPWRIDPAALDGAIQLAVVWAYEQIGRATLPMFVREARFRGAGLESGPLRCVVRAVSVGEQSAICDVLLLRPLTPPHGAEVVAALKGLELVARPG